ncbi:hypothetical protein HDV02_002156 [Globomyces sp. JEL0801]|nr:hypothetical protein HDV02_002141 [Globomyces sp. JEL0801]KAJ2999683.1 hypothetical protein HDV02_002156 [Globomyces sp. JEL0801]
MKRKQNQEKELKMTVESVRKLAKDILADTANLNNISTLLDSAKNHNLNPNELHAIFTSLTYVFIKLSENSLLDKPAKKSDDPKSKVSKWLRENRLVFLQIMASNISHWDTRIQITSFEKSLELVREASERTNEFQNSFYYLIVEAILNLESVNEILHSRIISTLNEYDDLRYFFFKNSNKCMESILDQGKQTQKQSQIIFEILLKLNPAQTDQDSIQMYCNATFTGKDESKTNQILVPNSYQRQFSDCWITFLRFPMNSVTYKGILETMHQSIIPFLSQPTSLMDFLVDAYNSGGFISILALNGVFTLIHKHNLDYPHFYPKLYALFDKNVLHTKYRSRFFRMASLFLSSTYIPTYLVASFIKRMCRIALFAPPSSIIMILPFIYNLLRLHPSCISLIHRTDVSMDEMNDPYLFDKLDPNESNAVDSCLWELESLKRHYCPTVSKLALIFEDSLAKPSYDLEDFFDHSYKTLIDAEVHSKKINSEDIPPLATKSESEWSELWVF